jgi:signal transduction histidine kinase
MLNRVLRHDLNNDVAVIENYARLLERDPGNEEYIEGLGRRAAEMRDLVETVRRVERHLDAETPARTRLDLARVVRERTAAVARAHPSATVDTDLPPAAWVTAMDLVGSAVDNVVENAVEHNDAEAPRVRVSVERVDVDGERYVDVVVADDGPRIDPADRAVLVGSEPSLDGATGLGLWLVNWIVTDSGGEVRYEPNEPRGNVVTLRLPAADAEPSSDREGEAEQSRAADSERARSGSSARSGPPDGTPAGD